MEAATLAGGEGGLVGYLTRMAKEQPVAFVGLLGRVLTMELQASRRGAAPSGELCEAVIVTWAMK